jgi:hypothetical protein
MSRRTGRPPQPTASPELHASHPLDDDEVAERFGSLVNEARLAFSTDPRYLVEMMEAAAFIIKQKAARKPGNMTPSERTYLANHRASKQAKTKITECAGLLR